MWFPVLLDRFHVARGLRRLLIWFVSLLGTSLAAWAAGPSWQNARIDAVQTKEQSRVTTWVANTPISQDDVAYDITVHLANQLILGSYRGEASQIPPPPEWKH